VGAPGLSRIPATIRSACERACVRPSVGRTPPMIPIVSIVGKSDTGKTTLIERLIPALKARGWRVGTIKHDAHSFEIDHEGKDTWRHQQAGADAVCISSPEKLALIRRVEAEYDLDRLESEVLRDGLDLILTEGYRQADKPKVEVVRSAESTEPLCAGDPTLIAVASDLALEMGVPHFHIDDAEGLAAFLEERFLARQPKAMVRLTVDGKRIPLRPFPMGALENLVRGFLASLRGCQEVRRIDITILPRDEA
ncbi:MAG: molybdopterin-guanine dinucleotide biosynthesis protein B, partial [Candidatus Tectimicrobiota bacterium]